MALSVRGTASAGAADGGDPSITLPGGTAEDDAVYVIGNMPSPGTDLNVSMSTSGYTELGDLFKAGPPDADANTGVYRKIMGATPDTTAVFNGSGSSFDGVTAACVVIDGVDTATPEDATMTTANGTSSQPNSPSITTVTDGAIVISSATKVSQSSLSGTLTYPSGYGDTEDVIQSDTASSRNVLCSKTVTTAGAEDPAAYSGFPTPNGGWIAVSVAVRPAAAGGSTVTPSQGDLTLSTSAPTVTATDNHTVSVPQGDLALSTAAPTIVVNATVAPTQGDLALSTAAPTVAATDNHPIAPTQGDLTLSTAAPTVTATDNHPIVVPQGDLALSTAAPTVDATQGTNKVPGQADLALTTSAPTVTATDNHPIAVPQGDLALSTAAATTATTDNHPIEVPQGDLTLTTAAPAVDAGDSVTAQTQQGDLVLSTAAPTIAATDNHTVAPSSVDLVLSGQSPSITIDYRVQPAAANLNLSTSAPTVDATTGTGDPNEDYYTGMVVNVGRMMTR